MAPDTVVPDTAAAAADAPLVGPECRPEQLFVSFGGGSVGSEQYDGTVVVTDLGGPCHLRGQPTVVGIDTAGRDVEVLRRDEPPEPPKVVNLAPEQSTLLSYHGVERAAGVVSCPAYSTLAFMIPGVGRRFRVPGGLCELSTQWVPADPYEASELTRPEPTPATSPLRPGAPAPTCAPEYVDVQIARSLQQHGRHVGWVLIITNQGPPCMLTGYPSVDVVSTTQHDSSTLRHQISQATPTPRGSFGGLPTDSAPAPVQLGTAEAASALIEGLVPALDGAPSCPAGDELDITLPGQTQPHYLSTDNDTGPGDTCELHIHPVIPGIGGGATRTLSVYHRIGVIGPVPTPRSSAPPCQSDHLSVSVGAPYGGTPTEPTLADSMGIVVFTNHGPPCSLYGYPTLTALDATGHPLVHAELALGSSQALGSPIQAVSLPTGQSASAAYSGYNHATEATNCPRYTSFLIAPPGDSHALPLAHTGTDCALTINPVSTGLTG